MKNVILFLILFLFSCSTSEKIEEATTALEAAQQFKLACLKGRFDVANYFITPESRNNFYYKELQKDYKLQSKKQEAKTTASIIIHSVKETSATTTQIVLKANIEKNIDTFTAMNINNKWFIKL